MNASMAAALINQVVTFLATWLAAKGYATDNFNADAITGGIVAIGSVAFSLYRHRKSNLVARAAALPEVSGVSLMNGQNVTTGLASEATAKLSGQ